MARDLVSAHLPSGMTESSVVAMLGPPDTTRQGHDACGRTLPHSRALSYFVGHPADGRYDDAYVLVHLDEQGLVVAAEVTGC